ncbi:hypothetical protein [Stomatobaculum longum]|jgi:hypothetical protein|uniref:hypothetical protein n=1 Tax=Stomatobaculum longum TaxID=796942 RepID=UPI0028DD206C|nr:hypothetical protein [Stomatobaculum longum]
MASEKRAQDRWNEKNGYISKSFRMYRSLAEEFKQACDSVGVSQAETIQQLMREFIVNQKQK